jgi:hypothetical protein
MRVLATLSSYTKKHPFILFVLWALFLSFVFWGFGPMSYVRVHDNGDHIIPARIQSASSLMSGQLAAWSPASLSGIDVHAPAYTSHLESLDFLVFAIFPGWFSYGLTLFLQRLVAGYFMFRLLRDTLDCDTLSSVYAGMFMAAFSSEHFPGTAEGYTVSAVFGIPALPAILWVLWKIGGISNSYAYLYAAVIGLIWSLFSVAIFTFFLLPTILFWFLFVVPQRQLSFWVKVVLFLAMWLLGNLPIILATGALVPTSHRFDMVISLSLTSSIRQAASFLEDTMVPIGLGVISFLFFRPRVRSLGFLLLIFGVFIGIIALYALIVRISTELIGGLSTIQFNRVYRNIPFLAAAIGGLGLQHFLPGWHIINMQNPQSRLAIRLLVATIVILVLVVQQLEQQRAIAEKMLDGHNYNALYNNKDLQQLAEDTQGSSPFRVVTVAKGNQHPAFAMVYGFETADGYVNLYPQRYQDYWGGVIAQLTSDGFRYDYFHTWGNRAYLFFPSTSVDSNQQLPFTEYYDLEMLSLANVRYIISIHPLAPDENLNLLASERTQELQANWQAASVIRKIALAIGGDYPGPSLYIYENQRLVPRFFLAEDISMLNDATQVLEALQSASYDDIDSTAYITREDWSGIQVPDSTGVGGTVQLLEYTSNRIVLNVRAEADTILVITNTFNPYWQVQIDGQQSRVLPVNHTFQGVVIEQGEHEVVLTYNPAYKFWP